MIISLGEKLSCKIFAAKLQSEGLPAVFVNLERVIDRHFSETQLDHHFYSYLKERLKAILSEHLRDKKIPVVTGFFGNVPGGLLNAVGRGYTDFTASLIAAGCGAAEFQIWKEVDGIYTADPNKVPGARVLRSITPAEAAELTFYGAEVIHPFTMEQAISAQIPIRIKNTFNPTFEGTLIHPTVETEGLSSQKRPTAVTVKHNVTVINVASNRKSLAHGFLANMFSIFDRHGIALDLISTSEVNVSLVVSLGDKDLKILPTVLLELQTLGKVTDSCSFASWVQSIHTILSKLQVTTISNLAIVSLVGQQMKSLVGIAGKMFSALAAASRFSPFSPRIWLHCSPFIYARCQY